MHFSITWRDLGRFTTSLYFLSIFLFLLKPSHFELLVLGLLFFILSFYGSQFAMQSIILGSLFLSILSLSMYPALLMIIGHIIIILFDRNYITIYYKFKYNHFKTYFYLFRHTHDQATDDFAFSLKHIKTFLSHIYHRQFSYANIVALKDPVLRGFYLLPIQVTVCVQLFFMHDITSMILLKWYLAATIIWFSTSSPWLKIFGEPDRYLEFFGYLPVLIGFGYTFEYTRQNHLYLFALTIVFVLFQFHLLALEVFKKSKRNEQNFTYSGLQKWRNDGYFLKGKNIFPITLSHSWKINYIFDCKTIYPPLDNIKEAEFLCNYPYPRLDHLNVICKKYNIEYFIAEKEYATYCEKEQIASITETKDVIGDFIVLKVKSDILITNNYVQ